MTFGPMKFCYDIGEVHSKREGLEITHLHLKSCFIFMFSAIDSLPVLQICAIFGKLHGM